MCYRCVTRVGYGEFLCAGCMEHLRSAQGVPDEAEVYGVMTWPRMTLLWR